MTVIGPVGPLICEGVPPNSEAKNPIIIAPVRPARAPMAPMLPTSSTLMTPKAWMPNANANGKATIPAVMPPNMSFLKFFFSKIFINLQFSKVKFINRVSTGYQHFTNIFSTLYRFSFRLTESIT